MKTYISDIIPKIQNFSEKLDNLTLLVNKHWVVIDEIENSKTVYIFRENKDLIISNNGKVEKGKWEYLGNNSLLIDRYNESYLFKHGFLDKNVLALKVDNREEYGFLIKEDKYTGELNSIEKISDFLKNEYLLEAPLKIKNNKFTKTKFDLRSITELENSNKIIKKLDNGKKLTIYSTSTKFDEFNIGDRIDIDGFIPENGNYHYGVSGCVTVENGIIRW